MDDADAMLQQTVGELRAWMHARRLEPPVSVAVLVAVLSEFMIAHRFKLITIAELLVQCGADFHDEWSKPLDALTPEEVARLMPVRPP
jgi:hypothetical protein